MRHKWYVGVECFKVGLYWRGVVHDLSKFLPSEFIPYSNHFFGNGDNISRGRNSTGYYKPTNTGDKAFDFAWHLHQKRNKHHWQWWYVLEDEGVSNTPFPIPEPYLTEMLCDWIGAGKAQGRFPPVLDKYYETRKWWEANHSKMVFHWDTKQEILKRLFRGRGKLIKEAAIKRISDGRVWTGHRHGNIISKIVSGGHSTTVSHEEFIQGFITNDGASRHLKSQKLAVNLRVRLSGQH